MSRRGKSTEIKSRVMVAGGWWRMEWEVTANEYGVPFWGD